MGQVERCGVTGVEVESVGCACLFRGRELEVDFLVAVRCVDREGRLRFQRDPVFLQLVEPVACGDLQRPKDFKGVARPVVVEGELPRNRADDAEADDLEFRLHVDPERGSG